MSLTFLTLELISVFSCIDIIFLGALISFQHVLGAELRTEVHDMILTLHPGLFHCLLVLRKMAGRPGGP